MSSRPRSPAAAPPLEDDNLLSEILLRLPPQPSSLPRASAVSKRWRSLVSDPRFVRRFRIHHRSNPPLLGFFNGFGQVLVLDPINHTKHRLPFPTWFAEWKNTSISGAVLRSAGDIQHFQVVFVGTETREQQATRVLAHVYSSETGAWGDLISTTLPPKASMDQLGTLIYPSFRSVLVGNSLYWLLYGSPLRILEFDLDNQRLNLEIPLPVDRYAFRDSQFLVMRADGGRLGFLFFSRSDFIAQLWKRKTNCDGVDSWVLGTTIQLDKLLSLNAEERGRLVLQGYAEDSNTVILETVTGIFTLHLESLQSKKVSEIGCSLHYHPFESVYTADIGISGGNDGAELSHNT
ncbi:unnamed protein product [Alopecurus aequalis]